MRIVGSILLILLLISCKERESKSGAADAKEEITEEVSSHDILTLFAKSTSFDFHGTSQEDILAHLDNLENEKALIKVFAREENGTGTLGWIEIDFDAETVLDITLDPKAPIDLSYDEELYDELKKQLILDEEIAEIDIDGFHCEDLEVENIYEEPLYRTCTCEYDFPKCYSLFFEIADEYHKKMLLKEMPRKDTTAYWGKDFPFTEYKISKNKQIKIIVNEEGGESEYIFKKRDLKTRIEFYAYPP